MKRALLKILACIGFAVVSCNVFAFAAPVTLGGMGIVGQWIDTPNGTAELPANPWGTSDIQHANRVGIYVEYSNGLTGSATYSGVANAWGGCCSLNGIGSIAPDTATGFFVGNAAAGYGVLHGLDNQGFILPMAWEDLSNQFTSNFDISYENFNNSTFRSDVADWGSVQITLYSSVGQVGQVPEPFGTALVVTGLMAMGVIRRRKAVAR